MSNYLKLLAIDPGTEFCGVSLIEHNTEGEIRSMESITLNSNRVRFPKSEEIENLYGDRYGRIYRIAHAFENILLTFNPHCVVCEAPFYHRLHPTAFAPLVELIQCLRDAVIKANIHAPFLMYPPILVKKTLSGNSFADKPAMKKALSEHPVLSKLIDIQKLSEHAIDASAVGYTHLKLIYKD